MKTIRIKILLLLFIAFGGYGYAQSNIRPSNFWIDTYFINPASIDDGLAMLKIGVQSRMQWRGINGAPITGSVNATYNNLKLNSQIGLQTTFDKIGYTSSNNAALTYAYYFSEKHRYRGKRPNWFVSLGFALRIQSLWYDTNEADFEDHLYDPATQNIYNTNKFNADLGIETYFSGEEYGYFWIGASCTNFVSFFETTDYQDPLAATVSLYLKYRFRIQKFRFSVNMAGFYSQNTFNVHDLSSGIFQYEINPNFLINFSEGRKINQLSIGMIYRTTTDIGAVLGYTWGNSKHRFDASVAYEFNLGYTNEYSQFGTFEVALVYRFDYYNNICYDQPFY